MEIQPDLCFEDMTTALDGLMEDRFLLVQLLCYACVLLAHSWKQKCDRPLCPLLELADNMGGSTLFQEVQGLFTVTTYYHAPLLKPTTSHLQRVSYICQWKVRIRLQMCGQVHRRLLQGRLGPG